MRAEESRKSLRKWTPLCHREGLRFGAHRRVIGPGRRAVDLLKRLSETIFLTCQADTE